MKDNIFGPFPSPEKLMSERDALIYIWGILVGSAPLNGDVTIPKEKMDFISKRITNAIYGVSPSIFSFQKTKDNGVVV